MEASTVIDTRKKMDSQYNTHSTRTVHYKTNSQMVWDTFGILSPGQSKPKISTSLLILCSDITIIKLHVIHFIQ